MPHISNEVTQRYVEALQILQEAGRIKDDAEFCRKTGISDERIAAFREGSANACVDEIDQAVTVFRFNPCYLFGGEGRPLLNLVLKVDHKRLEDALDVRVGQRVDFHFVNRR
jgi:hypothetical protein